MKVSPYIRIQWFHDELTRKTYPNAARLSERFDISVRQAQRDITYMRTDLGAPLQYDAGRQGYAYTTPFSLPVILVSENDESRSHVRDNGFADTQDGAEHPEADSVIIQSQIPYTAVLRIEDRLTVLEMRSYILSRERAGTYLCEFRNIDRFSTGSLVTRLTNDVTQLQNFVNTLLRMALRAPGMLIGALIMVISMDISKGTHMSLVLAIAVPVLAISIAIFIKMAAPRFTAVQNRVDGLNSNVQENLTNVRVVKSFVREEHALKKPTRS